MSSNPALWTPRTKIVSVALAGAGSARVPLREDFSVRLCRALNVTSGAALLLSIAVPSSVATTINRHEPLTSSSALAAPAIAAFNASETSSPYTATLVITTDASSASSAPESGATPNRTSTFTHHFTVPSPSFTSSDSDGRFTGQVTFAGRWPMAWSYKINQANTYAAAANSSVTGAADQYYLSTKKRVASYHDSHVESIDYLFHSTVPVNDQGVGLQLDMLFTWKWRLANSSGTAQLYATFNYTLYGPDGCSSPSSAALLAVKPDC
jgi:hypothetical protein